MTPILLVLALVLGVLLLASGLVRLLAAPIAVASEVVAARRRARGEPIPEGSLSVIVPCFDEGRILERCATSLVQAVPAGTQIILVDDGSTDDTWEVAQRIAAQHASVTAITKPNGGKGSALNAGLGIASGDFVLLTDADGIWLPESLDELLRGFADPRVGAVCGDDRTVNLDSVLGRFLALISHVGTGLMRRALSAIGCLPIVSGNVGCFRRSALDQVGHLREDTLGEDLELTWRVHEGGWRVVFRPRALVYAESPSTLRALWRQRVRWARGLFRTIAQHRRAIGNPRYGIFGLSLLPLAASAVLLPVAQLLAIPVLVGLVVSGEPDAAPTGVLGWLLWLSLPVALALVVLACALDRAWRDLRFAWTLPLWPLFSLWMCVVGLRGLWLEVRGAEQRWNKLERRGTVSVGAARDAARPVGAAAG
jgi:biofilm PGA synthesis N-glycosyltransferase PgaC